MEIIMSMCDGIVSMIISFIIYIIVLITWLFIFITFPLWIIPYGIIKYIQSNKYC